MIEEKLYRICSTESGNIVVEAFVTDACNMACRYCSFFSNGNKEVAFKSYLDLDMLEKFVVFLHRLTNSNIMLYLLGGEPTMHQNLLRFCKNISKHNFLQLNIYTNFKKNKDYYMQFALCKNTHFLVSFHYENQKQMVEFVEKTKMLTSIIDIKLMFVMLDDKNFDACIDAYNILNSYVDVQCNILDKTLEYQPRYSKEQIEIYQSLVASRTKILYDVETKSGKKQQLNFNDITDNTTFYHWLCNAGYSQFYIDLHGNIFPCKYTKCKISTLQSFEQAFKLKKQLCINNKKCTAEITCRENIFSK